MVWFFCYLSLMVAMLYRAFQLSPGLSFWGGYLLLWCAAIGRMISIRQLGLAFSEFIRVEKDQPLVDTGIYAYVRHPLHYFLMLEMVAMAWLAGFLWGWGVVGVAMITLVFREVQEERALVRAYGDRYRRYRQRALALIDLLPPACRE
ncbi:MAG: isoprenylcysteine carboxylmethyltransferase family protein [Nitrospinota bacterium]|nr:MAG: isoprenylcysteine carboxylmethyltransferase family protein [Nitrospinota bacterium]